MTHAPVQERRAVFLAIGSLLLSACAQRPRAEPPRTHIGFVTISPGLRLRQLVVRHPDPKGTVLLLHGFPETLYGWKGIAATLGNDYEVHAFDWPGYGLSSRPPADRFSYAPVDYARVLREYIDQAGIDRSSLVIYATDIGALPALLLALEEPHVARSIIVGDFAPFDRPQYMNDTLRNLKSPSSADAVRAALNDNRDEILANAFRRGLAPHEQFELPEEFRQDMLRGWNHGDLTSADAFYHYYSHFTRDQRYFETHIGNLRTPVKVLWGERDFYIQADMGKEFARMAGVPLKLLAGLGHYPHLQDPARTVEDIRESFAGR